MLCKLICVQITLIQIFIYYFIDRTNCIHYHIRLQAFSSNIGNSFSIFKPKYLILSFQGLISEAQVDTFILQVYFASPKEMTQLVERNGCFSIERMEITLPWERVDGLYVQACAMHLRAGMEGIISKHFGSEIIDKLFD